MNDVTVVGGSRLDLSRIERALKDVQSNFAAINERLNTRREPLEDAILENLLLGYTIVDKAISDGVDWFESGQSGHLLELNHAVLFGTNCENADRDRQLRKAAEDHFYRDRQGGISDVIDWLQMHQDESAWKRAAGVYTRILSAPQLFIEGNHRTGALIMSYILVKDGLPPFVLTTKNAKGYFDPSSVIKSMKKGSVELLFRMPHIKKEFAKFLKEQANFDHLTPEGTRERKK